MRTEPLRDGLADEPSVRRSASVFDCSAHTMMRAGGKRCKKAAFEAHSQTMRLVMSVASKCKCAIAACQITRRRINRERLKIA